MWRISSTPSCFEQDISSTKKTGCFFKHPVFLRAGDGIRTHDFNLGKVALYP